MNDAFRPTLQDLTAYLLGKVRADEAELLDELSITNSEFAEALEAAEMDLIDLYVNGELSTGDREQFEQIYMRPGHRNDSVVFARAFQEYASSRASATTAVSTGVGLFAWTGRYFQFGLAAAALLLVIVGGWFFISRSARNINETAAVPDDPVRNVDVTIPANYVENTQTELPPVDPPKKEPDKAKETPRDERAEQPRTVAVVIRPQLRSSGALPSVEVPAGTGQLSARLDLEPGDFRAYNAVLREQASNRVIWQSKSLKATGPADSRRLNVSVPARLLDSAIYNFTVSGVPTNGSPEIVGDYAFRVVR